MSTLVNCSKAVAYAVALSCISTGAKAEITTGNVQPPMAASTYEARLEKVGYDLATANPDKCDKPFMFSGLILHDLSSYTKEERASIARRTGMTVGFGVLAVVPGSGAARAQLEVGDEILEVNALNAANFMPQDLVQNENYARTEGFTQLLAKEMANSPVTLTVKRGEHTFTTTLAGNPGCGGRVMMMDSNALNAWSDGTFVAVTRKMMDFTENDDQLAFIVAHEMSHNILKHAQEQKNDLHLMAAFGIGSQKVRNSEVAADTLAVSLIMAAGTDLAAPRKLFKKLDSAYPINFDFTHPSFLSRADHIDHQINQALSEIMVLSPHRTGQTKLAHSLYQLVPLPELNA